MRQIQDPTQSYDTTFIYAWRIPLGEARARVDFIFLSALTEKKKKN